MINVQRLIFLLTMLIGLNAHGIGRLQDADFKTLTQITNAGGTAASLLNDTKIYVGANGINQTLNSAIGSGLIGGGAGVNLVSNGSFEASGITGWTTFQTTLTGQLPTGPVAACSTCSLAISANTAAPLNGKTSLQLVGASSITAGQGFISAAFPVSPAYRGQVLSIKGLNSLVSGSPLITGDSTGTFAIYAYDVTNSAWIQPAGAFGIVASAGPFAASSFQVPANTSSMRLAIVAINTLATPATLLFDDLMVSPGTTTVGPAMSDLRAWTPTGTWTTNTIYSGQYSRNGDRVSGRFGVQLTGAPASGNLLINFIPGLTIDTSKMPIGGARTSLGRCDSISGSAYTFEIDMIPNDPRFEIVYQSANSGVLNSVAPTTPVTWANGQYINCYFYDIPVVGFSTNVQQSSDFDGRGTTFQGTSNIAQTVGPAAPATLTAIKDQAGAWNGTGYVVQVAGDYIVGGSFTSTSINQAGYIAVNGNASPGFFSTVSTSGGITTGSLTVPNLKVGDVISMRQQVAATANVLAMNVNRISGAQPIQLQPSIIATYTLTAAQTIAPDAFVKYDTKVTDTNNICGNMSTTGLCTISTPGQYEVSTIALTTTGNASLYVSVSGTKVGIIASATTSFIGSGSITIPVQAGQTIGIAPLSTQITMFAAGAVGPNNRITIKRVGN